METLVGHIWNLWFWAIMGSEYDTAPGVVFVPAALNILCLIAEREYPIWYALNFCI